MTIISPPDVYIGETTIGTGRGVFAGRAFDEDEIVEVSPVLIFEGLEETLIERTKLDRYVFNWRVLAKAERSSSALAIGYGSMYNHANPSNMRYHADAAAHSLVFTTVRAIAKDEELTINYNAIGGGAEWHDDNWFARKRITPI